MDTELLRTFLTVQRTLHFAKAAEQLYLTPSAVSFRIRQLETELGVALFSRRRSNIQLTDAGERLVAHAEGLLAAWQQTRLAVGQLSPQRRRLVVVAPQFVWQLAAGCQLWQAWTQLPAVTWALEGGGVNGLRRLLDGSTDLLLMAEDPGPCDGVMIWPLTRLQWGWFGPANWEDNPDVAVLQVEGGPPVARLLEVADRSQWSGVPLATAVTEVVAGRAIACLPLTALPQPGPAVMLDALPKSELPLAVACRQDHELFGQLDQLMRELALGAAQPAATL